MSALWKIGFGFEICERRTAPDTCRGDVKHSVNGANSQRTDFFSDGSVTLWLARIAICGSLLRIIGKVPAFPLFRATSSRYSNFCQYRTFSAFSQEAPGTVSGAPGHSDNRYIARGPRATI